MGDSTTHAIFYAGYWHLAFKEGDDWMGSKDFGIICGIGAPDKEIELQR